MSNNGYKYIKPKLSINLSFLSYLPLRLQVSAKICAQRLKRIFKIDIETCSHCGGAAKIIACIKAPAVIETTAWMQEVEQRMEQLPKILTQLNNKTTSAKPAPLHESHAPPQTILFDTP